MKISEAMLKGYKKVGGQQSRGRYFLGTDERRPTAVCASGAILLGATGKASPDDAPINVSLIPQYDSFTNEWGFHISHLNEDGMPWEHIYGMAVAAGL